MLLFILEAAENQSFSFTEAACSDSCGAILTAGRGDE
jgi:hypothetical protein